MSNDQEAFSANEPKGPVGQSPGGRRSRATGQEVSSINGPGGRSVIRPGGPAGIACCPVRLGASTQCRCGVGMTG